MSVIRSADAGALQPYVLQDDDPLNACVDTQATNDETKDMAHYAFENDAPSCVWGDAGGWMQNECLQGFGTTPAGITQCIQEMWHEGSMPNCAGCVGCTAFGGACPNCDYYGTKGYACGDYVNLSAPYFTTVACGFSSASGSSTGWSVINFE